MNLFDYLANRYTGRPFGFTKKQAQKIGIPYPLVSGWVNKYRDTEVNAAELDFLATKRQRRLINGDSR